MAFVYCIMVRWTDAEKGGAHVELDTIPYASLAHAELHGWQLFCSDMDMVQRDIEALRIGEIAKWGFFRRGAD